jgi:hypothetical protein
LEPKRGETFVMSDKPIEWNAFLLGLASTALIHLGEVPHPESGSRALDLALARQSVELLGMLREKTRGNLTADEEKFFDQLLTDLRLRFVEASKAPAS